MSNKSKEDIIQVAPFFGGAIQGLVWTHALLKEFFGTVSHVMALGQGSPPLSELLPFDGIGSHGIWIKPKVFGNGTIR